MCSIQTQLITAMVIFFFCNLTLLLGSFTSVNRKKQKKKKIEDNAGKQLTMEKFPEYMYSEFDKQMDEITDSDSNYHLVGSPSSRQSIGTSYISIY